MPLVIALVLLEMFKQKFTIALIEVPSYKREIAMVLLTFQEGSIRPGSLAQHVRSTASTSIKH